MKEIKGNIFFNNTLVDAKTISKDVLNIQNNISLFLSPGDTVLVFIDRSPTLIELLYSLFQVNITYIPVDTSIPSKRLAFILEHTEIKYIICNKKYKTKFVKKQCIYIENLKLENLIGRAAVSKNNGNTNSIISYIIYTSGSTGNPKGVMVKKSSLINLMKGVTDVIPYKEGQTIACFTAVSFDIFFLESIMAMIYGLNIILSSDMEQNNPRLIKKLIEERHPDIIQMTPSRMTLLHQIDIDLKSLDKVKTILIGGEQFPIKLLKVLQEHTTARIYNMYGPTETTIWSMIADLTNETSINIGVPIRNTEVYLLDNNHEYNEMNIKGELGILGEGLCAGYYKAPELNQQHFITLNNKRCYLTGDIVKKTDNGKFIYIGRMDNQIKYHGYRIELEEIEEAIMKIPAICHAVCILDESDKCQKIIAFYDSKNKIELSVFRKFLSEFIPNYMMPTDYILYREFCFNSNGKIDRNALKDNYRKNHLIQTFDCSESIQSKIKIPNKDDGIVERIVEIFNEIISPTEYKFSATTDLASYGIASIDYIRILVEIENQFNMTFEDEQLNISLFKNISQIADYVVKVIKT